MSITKKILTVPESWLCRNLPALRFLPDRPLAYLLMRGLIHEKRALVSLKRLWNLYELCSNPSLPYGSFVECGVARGGSIAVMSFVSRGDRSVWGFDSFEGMPDLSKEDEGDGQEWVGFNFSGSNGLSDVESTLNRFHVSGNWVNLVPGWFEETLPQYISCVGPIAVLRLDNDWYKSTKYCLNLFYDKLEESGVVIIDDYHTYIGCRKAVDEFRKERSIESPIITTDLDKSELTEVYWRKI